MINPMGLPKVEPQKVYTLDQAMPLCVERIMAHPDLDIISHKPIGVHWAGASAQDVVALLNSKEKNDE